MGASGQRRWAPLAPALSTSVQNAHRCARSRKQERRQRSVFPCPGERCRHVGLPASRGSRAEAGPYLLSPGPGPGPCSGTPTGERPAPAPRPLSGLALWAGGSGPAGAHVLLSVGGSGGWKAGDTCFLVRVPPRRQAWKSTSFTPKLQRKETAHEPATQKPRSPSVRPALADGPQVPSKQQSGEDPSGSPRPQQVTPGSRREGRHASGPRARHRARAQSCVGVAEGEDGRRRGRM